MEHVTYPHLEHTIKTMLQ